MTTRNPGKSLVVALVADALLVGCGTGSGPAGRTAQDVAQDDGTAVPATTEAPTPPPGDAPLAAPEADSVTEFVEFVASSGVANSYLLDPAIASRDELLAPALAHLTLEARTGYEQSLPPDGQPHLTSAKHVAELHNVDPDRLATANETSTRVDTGGRR
jgi:hypothetical protein